MGTKDAVWMIVREEAKRLRLRWSGDWWRPAWPAYGRFSFIAPLGRIPAGRGQFGAMPLFEYECRGCGTRFEELVRGSEAVACPRCGRGNVAKLLSRFAVGAGERPAAPAEPGPCGACGAPVRGACAVE